MQNVHKINARNLHRMVANIEEVYTRVDDETRHARGSWYFDAFALCGDLGWQFGVDVYTTCGIVAALSPMLAWHKNLEYAHTFLATGGAPTMKGGVRKAQAIRDGAAVLEILSGPKVRAFYQCLARPHSSQEVVVDRHAFDIAVGRVTDDKTRKQLERVGVYELVAAAYRIVAQRHGVPAHSVQASTWCTWRLTEAAHAKANAERELTPA